MCQGYYRHAEGYTPQWPGMERFQGRIVHPQTWPEDLALDGKKVVVIGSGATAATLIPAIAERCAHVTMLQRSPTFFITGRNANELADMLRQLEIPDEWTHEIVRRKVLFDQAAFTRRCVAEPEVVRQELLAGVRAALGPGHEAEVDKHFNPRYRPWQQRIAFVPDADLFKCVREGKASVVTDQIESFERRAASACSRASCSKPTSSSPPPASTSACWATSPSASTASHWTLPDTWAGAARCSAACRTWPGCSATSAPAGRCAPTCWATSSAGCCSTWTHRARRW